MNAYCRQTFNGLLGLALDAFEAPLVIVGEKVLAWWDRRNPCAHDLDMTQDRADFDRALAEDAGGHIDWADYLAEAEAEKEVWEPEPVIVDNAMYRTLAIDIITELLAEQAPRIYDALFSETDTATTEKQ